MSVDLFTPNELGFDIPPEAVHKLMEDARKADETAKQYADMAAAYARKLNAIRELAPHLFADQRPKRATNVEPDDESPRRKTVIDAVVDAVDKATPAPLLPKHIRKGIVAQGDGDLLTNDNYLYTAIKRAADSGRIVRRGEAYISASKAEGPGE